MNISRLIETADKEFCASVSEYAAFVTGIFQVEAEDRKYAPRCVACRNPKRPRSGRPGAANARQKETGACRIAGDMVIQRSYWRFRLGTFKTILKAKK
jgi:hypothetical protein